MPYPSTHCETPLLPIWANIPVFLLLKRTEQPFWEVYFENVGQPEIEHKREKIFFGYSKINTLRDRSLFKSKGVAVGEKMGGPLNFLRRTWEP